MIKESSFDILWLRQSNFQNWSTPVLDRYLKNGEFKCLRQKLKAIPSRDQSDSGTSTFLWKRYLLFISFLIRIQYSDKDIRKFLQKSIFVLLKHVYFT